jgi:hypothetical protein
MNYVGCCGHDCSCCVTYQATVKNDDTLRKQAQLFYREMFNREIPLKDIQCMGCQSECIFKLAEVCPFTKCVREKQLESCSDCAEHPCPMLVEYQKKYVNKCNQI